MKAPTKKKSPRAAALATLALAVFIAYSNSFSTGFALDNQMLILGDPRIRDASAANLGLILQHTYWWPNGESGLYRPATTLSYLLNYAVLGESDQPAGYHWMNLLLHEANVFLLFALVLRLTKGRFLPAFFAALLWGLHPVLTESVTNIVGRADLLAGFAVLSGFLCYLQSRDAIALRRAVWLAALAVATFIGVFSKEGAVVLPAVIVLYELVSGKKSRAMLAGICATLLSVGFMLWQRAAVLSSALPAEYPFLDNPIAGAGFWVGRLSALSVLGRYLWLVLWPVTLSADYSYAQIPLARGDVADWLAWLTVAVSLGVLALMWRRNRLAFFFAAFGFLNWLPASNFFFPIGTMMAERLLYLPLLGWLTALILLAHQATDRQAAPLKVFIISGAVLALVFGIRTWLRNPVWTGDKSMAIAGVRAAPRSFKFHRLLAAQLLASDPSQSDVNGALLEADRAVEILSPVPDEMNSAGAWNLAAVCHRVKGDQLAQGDDSRRQYLRAVELASRAVAIDAAARAAYSRKHGIREPVPPAAADGYRTLASAYLHLGKAAEALAAANRAQSIDPANSGVYVEIADAQAAQGRGEEAAIALAEGMFASGDPNLLAELLKLYRSGVDAKACAEKLGPHGPTLNPSCDIVHRDLCEATRRIGRQDLTRRMACGAGF